MRVAIIAITRNGVRLGAQLQEGLPKSGLFAIQRYATGEATAFSEGVKEHVARLWDDYEGFVFIMATGIVVRAIAPFLSSKDRDPAVVVIDDAGRFAISLVSGHLGGANALARSCAELIGSVPVITTATDANDLPSFDLLAKEHGWVIDDLSKVKILNTLLLEEEEIAVVDASGLVRSYFADKGRLSFHPTVAQALASPAAGFLFVTDEIVKHDEARDRLLILRPRATVVGIGCNRDTSAQEIAAAVGESLEHCSLSLKGVRCLATAQAKRDEVGLLEFAAGESLPILFFDSDELNAVEVPSPPSGHALDAIGAKGVAEPAAILGSAGGTLVLEKVKNGNVTVAIAIPKGI